MKWINRKNTPPPTPAETERLRKLIAAFMDGATDRAQEREIYDFFRTYGAGTLPAGLEQYRPMFAWYAGLEQPAAAPAKRHHPMRVALGAAAALAVLVVAGVSLMRSPEQTEQQNYGYTISNGRRVPLTTTQKMQLNRSQRLMDSLTNDSLIFEAATTGVRDSESSEIIRNILSQ